MTSSVVALCWCVWLVWALRGAPTVWHKRNTSFWVMIAYLEISCGIWAFVGSAVNCFLQQMGPGESTDQSGGFGWHRVGWLKQKACVLSTSGLASDSRMAMWRQRKNNSTKLHYPREVKDDEATPHKTLHGMINQWKPSPRGSQFDFKMDKKMSKKLERKATIFILQCKFCNSKFCNRKNPRNIIWPTMTACSCFFFLSQNSFLLSFDSVRGCF